MRRDVVIAGATGAFTFKGMELDQRKTLISGMEGVVLGADDSLRVLEVSAPDKTALVYTVPFEKLEYLVYAAPAAGSTDGPLREGATGTPSGGTSSTPKTTRRRTP